MSDTNSNRIIECPSCGTTLKCYVVANVTGAVKADEEFVSQVSQDKLAKQRILEAGADLLAVAKELGVFDSFNQALDALEEHKPKDREFYFLKWITKAQRKHAPQMALAQCLPNGAKLGRLEAWGWQYVMAIRQAGEIKMFLPTQLLHGDPIEKLEITKNGIKPVKSLTWQDWVKTKHGYVEKSSEFAAELRKRSFGDFALN